MFDKQADLEAKFKAAKKLKDAKRLKANIAYEKSVMKLGIKEMKIDPYEWDNSNLD